MIVYFITGASSGIGKAIAEEALNDGQAVVGLSRHHTIEHQQYFPVTLDLNDLNETNQFQFQLPELNESVEKVVLINNSGVIEPVRRLGNTDKDSIENNFNVNLVAPVILINNFLSLISEEYEKVIINVSSGAAQRPMDGWACYCSSKAALDMVTQVVDLESLLDNRNCRIYALAPGIVDTAMQEQIRSAEKEEFSRLEDFKNFKKEGMLIEPKEVAKKFIEVVNNSEIDLNVIDRLN